MSLFRPDAAATQAANTRCPPLKATGHRIGLDNYGEQRMQTFGRLDGRLHVLAFTMRGDVLRAISFRKANSREEIIVVHETGDHDPHAIDDIDNPELAAEDFARAKPFAEVFPHLVEQLKRQGGRPRLERPKVNVSWRLSADVVDAVKATRKGYNARVDNVLRDAIAKGIL